MKLVDWFKAFLKRKTKAVSCFGEEIDEYVADLCFREIAFNSAINLIANAVSKCEIKTFSGRKEIKEREYYLWNYSPNKNQNSTAFIHQLLDNLYRKNECLVVEQNQQLLVADDFTKTEYALYDNVFTDVRVKDFTFNKNFTAKEVLYFRLSEKDNTKILNAMYGSYQRLLTYNIKSYLKSRGTKGVLTYETLPVAGSDQRAAFDDLVNNRFKTYMNADSAILPLGKGQDFKDTSRKETDNTRDIRAMIDDISDFTSKALGIPPAILRGDVQDVSNAVDVLLTFCVDPLTDMITEEINRKRYGYAGFAKGDYLKIDTTTIKHIDILNSAVSVDKLIACGAYSINGIREIIGEERIDEDWADKHFITKNYIDINEMNALEGGNK